MGSKVKFYARDAHIENLNMTDMRDRIFDSNFCCGSIVNSSFENAEFNNCNVTYTNFVNVSFKNTSFYRLITGTTRFTKCNFTWADMNSFTFEECIFIECDFSECYMKNITFKSCSFYSCDFENAELPPYFYPNTMEDCVNVPYIPMACPEEGEFIGYKIASSEQRSPSEQMLSNFPSLVMPYDNQGPANVLVTLKIPADARRSSAGGRKCRCNKAKVIGLEFFGGHEGENVAYSKFDARFEYRVGEEISVPFFDENRWHECASGIHFFINRKEALQHYGLL